MFFSPLRGLSWLRIIHLYGLTTSHALLSAALGKRWSQCNINIFILHRTRTLDGQRISFTGTIKFTHEYDYTIHIYLSKYFRAGATVIKQSEPLAKKRWPTWWDFRAKVVSIQQRNLCHTNIKIPIHLVRWQVKCLVRVHSSPIFEHFHVCAMCALSCKRLNCHFSALKKNIHRYQRRWK